MTSPLSIIRRRHMLETDGRTIWLTGPAGDCRARFGPGGLDIHRSVTDQIAGEPQCLDCTHGRPGEAEWERFQVFVSNETGIVLDRSWAPSWLS